MQQNLATAFTPRKLLSLSTPDGVLTRKIVINQIQNFVFYSTVHEDDIYASSYFPAMLVVPTGFGGTLQMLAIMLLLCLSPMLV